VWGGGLYLLPDVKAEISSPDSLKQCEGVGGLAKNPGPAMSRKRGHYFGQNGLVSTFAAHPP
jgi:hypothetical protein